MIIQTEYQTFTPKQEYLKFEPNKSFVISVASRAELIIFVIIYNLLFKKKNLKEIREMSRKKVTKEILDSESIRIFKQVVSQAKYVFFSKGLAKQKKKAATVTEKDQGNYVDSSRNTAVNLDSKELSKTLKKIKNDDGEIDNTGIVNSDMYQREAQHYASKGLHGASSKNLSIGK